MSSLARFNDRWCPLGQTNPFSGTMLQRYPDGRLQSRSVVSNGLLQGLSEGWHTNGSLQVQEYYRENFSEGLRTKWYPSGAKQSEAQIVHGKLEGTFRRWHENGVLAEQGEFKNGEAEGISRAWYPSGFLKAEVTLRQGKVMAQQYWKDGEKK